MKQVLITLKNNHHFETEMINGDGHTFTFNPIGKNEGLSDFLNSAPEENVYSLFNSLVKTNKQIEDVVKHSDNKLGSFVFDSLNAIYIRNKKAMNDYLKQEEHLKALAKKNKKLNKPKL